MIASGKTYVKTNFSGWLSRSIYDPVLVYERTPIFQTSAPKAKNNQPITGAASAKALNSPDNSTLAGIQLMIASGKTYVKTNFSGWLSRSIYDPVLVYERTPIFQTSAPRAKNSQPITGAASAKALKSPDNSTLAGIQLIIASGKT